MKNKDENINKILELISSGKFNEADEIFQRIYKKSKHDPNFLNFYATFNLNLKNYEISIKHFKNSIKIKPIQPEIYFKLGVIYAHLSMQEAAFKSYKKSESLNCSNPDLYNNLGIIYFEKCEFDLALECFKKAIFLKNNHPQALNNLGNTYKKLNSVNLAINSYKKAISYSKKYVNAYINLAATLIEVDDNVNALEYLNILINLEPHEAKHRNDRGIILDRMGKTQLAFEDYNKAIELNQKYAEAFNNRGILFFKEKKYSLSLNDYNKAINLKSTYAEAYNNRSRVFLNNKDYSKAIEDLNIAIKLNSKYAEAYSNLGFVYFVINKFELALQNYNVAIYLNSNFKLPELNKSILLLLLSNYTQGWALYESRWRTKKFVGKELISTKPIFNLNFDRKKTIFIYSEQGIGDQILFMSILRDIHEIYNNIIVSLDPRLIAVYKRSFKKISFLSNNNLPDENLYDCHLAMGSLGLFFRQSISSFKKIKNSYLLSNDIVTMNFSKKLHSNKKLVCGISWKSKNDDFGHNKSIDLKKLIPIINHQKLNIVNLQYGEVTSDIKTIFNVANIQIESFDEIDKTNDIDGLFSLVDSCDFIVTISNVTAHIAGSLGKKVFLLAPRNEGKLFYWGKDGCDCLWYPTVQIFRQSNDGTWDEAIQQIKKETEIYIINNFS